MKSLGLWDHPVDVTSQEFVIRTGSSEQRGRRRVRRAALQQPHSAAVIYTPHCPALQLTAAAVAGTINRGYPNRNSDGMYFKINGILSDLKTIKPRFEFP